MEQGFAFQVEASRQIINASRAIHSTQLFLGVAVITILVITIRRAANGADMWWWLIAAAASPIIGLSIIDHNPIARNALFPTVLGYMSAIEILAAVGAITTLVRVKREERVGAVGCSLFLFVLLGFLVNSPSLMPSVVNDGARRTQCKINIKQLGLALMQYHDDHQRLPGSAAENPAISWRVTILPYLESKSLFDEYNPQNEWNSEQNRAVIPKRPSFLTCPSTRNDARVNPTTKQTERTWFTDYVMPMGPGAVTNRKQGRSWDDFTDGRAHTLLIAEACGLEIVWTEPRDFDTAIEPIGINLSGHGKTDSPGLLSSYHLGGAHIGLADGSVRLVSYKIDPEILKALTTVAGGESNSDGW